jgi:hypothetical protein
MLTFPFYLSFQHPWFGVATIGQTEKYVKELGLEGRPLVYKRRQEAVMGMHSIEEAEQWAAYIRTCDANFVVKVNVNEKYGNSSGSDGRLHDNQAGKWVTAQDSEYARFNPLPSARVDRN